MKQLEQRKADLKARITALSSELHPAVKAVENLRERIDSLETDLRTVLDQIQEAENAKRVQV